MIQWKLVFANIIRVIHLLVVLFVLVTPFISKDPMLLLLHSITCLSLFVHWVTNDSTCALSMLESTLRGIPMSHSFVHQIVAPIYAPPPNVMKHLSYVTVLLLGSFTGYTSVIEKKSLKTIYDAYKSKSKETRIKF